MHISKPKHYLCFSHHIENSRYEISVQKDAKSLISKWETSTRISPIWQLNIELAKSSVDIAEEIKSIFFISAKNLFDFFSNLSDETLSSMREDDFWVTIGVHNLIIFSRNSETDNEIHETCRSLKIFGENWSIEEYEGSLFTVDEISECPPILETATDTVTIAKQPNPFLDALELDWGFNENDANLETSIIELSALYEVIRNRCLTNSSVLIDDLNNIKDHVLKILKKEDIFPDIKDKKVKGLKKRDILLGLNAGLSRLASQATAGTSPLTQTECHFWPHSFLGLGVANLALRNLAAFVSAAITEQSYHLKYYLQLDEKVDPNLFSRRSKAAEQVQYFDVLNLWDTNLAEFSGLDTFSQDTTETIKNKIITETYDNDNERETLSKFNDLVSPPPVPITYFSSRDGFRNGLFTTSAPLLCINGCISKQWNLGTITHELSHRITSGKLSELNINIFHSLSELISTGDTDTVYSYLKKPASKYSELCQRYLLLTYMAQERALVGDKIKKYAEDPLVFLENLVFHHGDETEERLVHTFDYYHFYNKKAENYVSSVWLSWAVQPSIILKLDSYIERTLIALASPHLHLKDWKTKAKDEFIKALNSSAIGTKLEHKETILKKLTGDWENLELFLERNTYLLALFHLAFKSDDLSNMAENEPLQAHGGKKVYDVSSLDFGSPHAGKKIRFSNPLKFIRQFAIDHSPDESESAWLLHMLAFNWHHTSSSHKESGAE